MAEKELFVWTDFRGEPVPSKTLPLPKRNSSHMKDIDPTKIFIEAGVPLSVGVAMLSAVGGNWGGVVTASSLAAILTLTEVVKQLDGVEK